MSEEGAAAQQQPKILPLCGLLGLLVAAIAARRDKSGGRGATNDLGRRPAKVFCDGRRADGRSGGSLSGSELDAYIRVERIESQKSQIDLKSISKKGKNRSPNLLMI